MALNRVMLWVLFAAWLAAIALSFVAVTQAPTGDGFTRGLNRITGFLSWQIAAGVIGVGLWIGVRGAPAGDRIKWFSRLPGLWAAILFLALVVWILIGVVGAQISKNRAAEFERLGTPTVTTEPAE